MVTSHRKLRALGLGAWLAGLGTLVWLSVMVSSDDTQGFDSWARNGVHAYASPLATSVADVVTTLGSVLFLSIAFAVALIALSLARLRREVIRLTTVMAGAIGLENGMKYGIHRVRPDPFFGVDPTTYSFPSGHALLSLCFYFTLAAMLVRHRRGVGRYAIRAAGLVLAAAIGLSRVYLGVHYPTDVIAGFLTGALWIAAVWVVEPRWWPRRTAPPPVRA